LSELKKTGLLQPGATGSFSHHYKFPNNFSIKSVVELKNKIENALPDRSVKVLLPEDSSEQTGRTLNYLTDFMSLAALIGLLLALIGIFYLYQSHLIERLKDLGLFHLLGISKIKIISKVF
jgi:predicted lysophospholipase L1 biosynthesis ABC-type transport system permease subunit